jgi:hypothetical protein
MKRSFEGPTLSSDDCWHLEPLRDGYYAVTGLWWYGGMIGVFEVSVESLAPAFPNLFPVSP